MLQELHGLCFFLTGGVVELHDEHEFARGRVAQHDVTKESALVAKVEEGETVLEGIVTNAIAKAIVDVVHEVTLLNVENLVKRPSDVETNGVHIVELNARLHLFEGQPLLV